MAVEHQYQVLIIGAGSAGITVAARLRRHHAYEIGILDPAGTHHYQPLWTLVGGGRAPAAACHRPMDGLIPAGVDWIRQAATGIDPENRTVTTSHGTTLGYDHLVVCPGIQLDWGEIPGMADALTTPAVSSNYRFDLTPRTWEAIRSLRSGTAVFTMPDGPIKCGGAPQKIAYLAADYWREQGVLDQIRVVLVVPTPGLFGIPVFARELDRVARQYGIEVRTRSEAVEIDPVGRQVVVADHGADSKEALDYDFLHVVPPQSAPDWLEATPLTDPGSAGGYVEVDKHTLQHTRYPTVFALGDAASTPNSKTGAAVRKQAPVVVDNLLASIHGRPLTASYDGYSSCPLTTSRHSVLLAEFDYSMKPAPTFPFVDLTRERRDMWYLKRYGLPAMYWHLMLKGRA